MSNNSFRNIDKWDAHRAAYCADYPCDLKFLKEKYGDCYHMPDFSIVRCGAKFCNKEIISDNLENVKKNTKVI